MLLDVGTVLYWKRDCESVKRKCSGFVAGCIQESLRLNPRNVHLLDTGLMILVIAYGILKIKKSLGLEM